MKTFAELKQGDYIYAIFTGYRKLYMSKDPVAEIYHTDKSIIIKFGVIYNSLRIKKEKGNNDFYDLGDRIYFTSKKSLEKYLKDIVDSIE